MISEDSAARTNSPKSVVRKLRVLHEELDSCRSCSEMIGPVVHGPPIASPVFLVGQAPGPHEGKFNKPFAWTAGKTMFRWFEEALRIDEETFRARIYMAAVARCFPGKAKGGGDRKPNGAEIEFCKSFLAREVQILQPELVLPVGTLALEQIFGKAEKLNDVIGTVRRIRYHGVEMDAIALPHPSGASPWHKLEPGKTLLGKAMKLIAKHPAMKKAVQSEI